MQTRLSCPILLLGLAAMLGACTHTYALRVRGTAAAGSRVSASYWAQPEARAAPRQVPGRSTLAGEDGRFALQSKTVLDFSGPPPHVVLEVDKLGPFPVCVIVPTEGLWTNGDEATVDLEPLRALDGPAPAYEIGAKGLSGGVRVRVVRRNPDKPSCVAPGD